MIFFYHIFSEKKNKKPFYVNQLAADDLHGMTSLIFSQLTLVAQLEACLTDDKEVMDSIAGNILSLRLITKYILHVIFWRKNVHKCWLTA